MKGEATRSFHLTLIVGKIHFMKKPIIAITTSTKRSDVGMQKAQLAQAYIDAVQEAGGIPVLIAASVPPEDAAPLADSVDGLLLTGGGDVSPDVYDGLPCSNLLFVDDPRDALELALAKKFYEIDKPLLGICRGQQVMNIALGGTLYTDIPSQYDTLIGHQNPGPNVARTRREIVHEVSIVKGSMLWDIYQMDATGVNSFHHQAILKLADGLEETAHAPDGILEGIVDPRKKFFLGVQWHPEWLTYQPQTKALFSAFIKAC